MSSVEKTLTSTRTERPLIYARGARTLNPCLRVTGLSLMPQLMPTNQQCDQLRINPTKVISLVRIHACTAPLKLTSLHTKKCLPIINEFPYQLSGLTQYLKIKLRSDGAIWRRRNLTKLQTVPSSRTKELL